MVCIYKFSDGAGVLGTRHTWHALLRAGRLNFYAPCSCKGPKETTICKEKFSTMLVLFLAFSIGMYAFNSVIVTWPCQKQVDMNIHIARVSANIDHNSLSCRSLRSCFNSITQAILQERKLAHSFLPQILSRKRVSKMAWTHCHNSYDLHEDEDYAIVAHEDGA